MTECPRFRIFTRHSKDRATGLPVIRFCVRYIDSQGNVVKTATLKATTKEDAKAEGVRGLDEFVYGVKRCSGCGKYKPVGQFYHHADKPDGLSRYCKDCQECMTRGEKINKRKSSGISRCYICGELFKNKAGTFPVCNNCKIKIRGAYEITMHWFKSNGVNDPSPDMYRAKSMHFQLYGAVRNIKMKESANG